MCNVFCGIAESSRHHVHPGRCVRHHARSGRGSRPDYAAEASSPDQHSRTLQQLEPGLHHPPLRRQGQSEAACPKCCNFNLHQLVFDKQTMPSS